MKYISIRSLFKTAVIIILILSAQTSYRSYGDDAVYMGDGVNVYPIIQTDIRLVSEEIKITQGVGLGWGVDVTMHFKNEGRSTSVQMGFPFDAYSPDDGALDENDQAESKLTGPNFHAFVDGKELSVVKKKGVKNPEIQGINFPIIYTFDVPFQHDETKTIRHTYSVGGYMNTSGHRSFKYILRTGSLWKGPIDLIKISAAINAEDIPYLDPIDLDESSAEKIGDKIILYWTLKNIKPDTDLIISKTHGQERTIEDFLKEDKEGLMTVSHSTHSKIRYLRNLIYASYGYPFKNPYVRAQFYYSNSKYSESPTFSENKIKKAHIDYINYLAKIEKRQKIITECRTNGLLPPEQDFQQIYTMVYNNPTKIAVGFSWKTGHFIVLSWPDMIPKGYIENPMGKPKIKPCAISPNGKYFSCVVSYEGSKNGIKLIFLDLENRRLISIRDANQDDFFSNFIKYSPDSSKLITLSTVYNSATGEVVKSLPHNPQDRERLIRSNSSRFFYRYNNRLREISILDINKLENVQSLKYSDFASFVNISPDDKYLVGNFSKTSESGYSRLASFLRIYKINENSLNLIHEEPVSDRDYPVEILFGKHNDMAFVIKDGNLFRYVISQDDKVRIDNFGYEGIQNIKAVMRFRYNTVDGFGKMWDLETGQLIYPLWDVLSPADSTKIFPLYAESPPPVYIANPEKIKLYPKPLWPEENQ